MGIVIFCDITGNEYNNSRAVTTSLASFSQKKIQFIMQTEKNKDAEDKYLT